MWIAPAAWPWALTFVLAATAATAAVPDEGLSRDGIARAVLFVPAALGLLLPAIVGLLATADGLLHGLARGGRGGSWLALLAVALGLAVLLGLALRWPERWPDAVLLGALTLVLLAGRLAFVWAVAKAPVSDFAGMWRLAGWIADDGLAVVTEADDHLTRVHFERILPYLLPARLLFGPGRFAYAVPNVLLAVASSWLTYLLARGWFSRPAARAAFAISAVAPETLYATGIPGHDLPGAFFSLLALVAFRAVATRAAAARWPLALAASLGLGLVLLVADLQRTNGPFLLLAFALVLAAEQFAGGRRPAWEARGRRLRRWSLAFVVPLLVYLAGDAVLRAHELRMSGDMDVVWRSRAIAGHTDSWGTGTQGYAVEQYYDRYPRLTGEQWSSLAWRKLLTDLHRNPGEWASSLLRKARSLWQLGRQRSFYLRDAEVVPLGRPLGSKAMRLAGEVNSFYVVVFLVLMSRGLVRVWRRREAPIAVFLPAVYLALLAGFLVVLFQPQSRYLFQVWYLGGLYCGAALVRARGESD